MGGRRGLRRDKRQAGGIRGAPQPLACASGFHGSRSFALEWDSTAGGTTKLKLHAMLVL